MGTIVEGIQIYVDGFAASSQIVSVQGAESRNIQVEFSADVLDSTVVSSTEHDHAAQALTRKSWWWFRDKT